MPGTVPAADDGWLGHLIFGDLRRLGRRETIIIYYDAHAKNSAQASDGVVSVAKALVTQP